MKFKIKRRTTKVRKNEKWWYVLVGQNGEVLLTSEKYHNLDDVEKIIRKIKVMAPTAIIEHDWIH